HALVNKGVMLGELQQPEEEITAYDEVLRRFGESQELALQKIVANALRIKGITLGELQQPEAAIAAYDEVLRRFGESQELALQEAVAQTLVNKGITLGNLQQPEAEIAAYDELLRRFSTSLEPALKKHVAHVSNSRGFAMLLKAKKAYNNPKQWQSLLQAALTYFEQALAHIELDHRALVLGNQGYTLFLLEHKTESERVLQEALGLGGQTLYEAELADSRIEPLPEDAAFCTLLDRLWHEISTATAIKSEA
ncbi:MAG: hypothetical protein PHD39_12305, partial [Methylobacter tundripaludum]|nr:hypothetical protein [Methylobacter tundripaludum]